MRSNLVKEHYVWIWIRPRVVPAGICLFSSDSALILVVPASDFGSEGGMRKQSTQTGDPIGMSFRTGPTGDDDPAAAFGDGTPRWVRSVNLESSSTTLLRRALKFLMDASPQTMLHCKGSLSLGSRIVFIPQFSS